MMMPMPTRASLLRLRRRQVSAQRPSGLVCSSMTSSTTSSVRRASMPSGDVTHADP